MKMVLTQLQELEEGPSIGELEAILYDKLQGQLFYLLGKAMFERKLLSKLRAELKKSR